MDYVKGITTIIVLFGALLFLASLFLPFASPSSHADFVDLYYLLDYWIGGSYYRPAIIVLIGSLVTAVLHPITIALAFLSIAKPRLTRVAGILGIASCVAILVAVTGLIYENPGLEYAAGIWIALSGAIILLISGYIGKGVGGALLEARPVVISSPPPPPPPAPTNCPTCGNQLRYIQQYQRWYCDKEQKYV